MALEIILNRHDETPWGFRMTGGKEFESPFFVVKVIYKYIFRSLINSARAPHKIVFNINKTSHNKNNMYINSFLTWCLKTKKQYSHQCLKKQTQKGEKKVLTRVLT